MGRPKASWGAREGDRARQGVPWGGARWREALGRGAAVVPSRPADRASGGRRVVGATDGGQVCAGGRFGAHGQSSGPLLSASGGLMGRCGRRWGIARAKAYQRRVGRAGPAWGGLVVSCGPGLAGRARFS